MEKKINVAELLKDCPGGMELDCSSYDNVSFDKISDDKNSTYPIFCYITDKEGNRSGISFTENGCESKRYGAKCVIFPKGKTTWEGFHRPFKDGDVCYLKTNYFEYIFIFKISEDYNYIKKYVNLSGNGLYIDGNAVCPTNNVKEIRFATEKEKQKLFDTIKAKGFKWNEETKTLERLIELKFKVGDKIKQIGFPQCHIIKTIEFDRYILDNNKFVRFRDEHLYELVPNKFDISTLKPFESRVLVRDKNGEEWRGQFFSHYYNNSDRPYICIGTVGLCEYKQCIPYEGNEHLLSTKDDCDDFYKIW